MFDINEYLNILPNDFCHIIYWYLNDDLQEAFDINDFTNLAHHWVNFGQRENRQYNIPINIIQSFDSFVYKELYDDIRDILKTNIESIIHYYRYGIHEKRIASTNEIILPFDFFTNCKYAEFIDHNLNNINDSDIYRYKINYIKSCYKNNNQNIIISDHNINNIDTNDIILKENPNFFFIINNKLNSIEQFINYGSNLKKYTKFDYFYFCDSDEIDLYYINHIRHNKNLIFSELIYDNTINNLQNVNKSIIIHKSLLDIINKDLSINIDTNKSLFLNLINILSEKNIKYNIPLLFILETDDIDFNYMFMNWIRYIKIEHNIHIIVVSNLNNNFDIINKSEYPFIHLIHRNYKATKQINYLNILFYIRSKSIYSDWIIVSKNKIRINIDIIYNITKKWFNYNIIFNQNIYVFKSKELEYLINYFINIEYDFFLQNTKTNDKINNNINNIMNISKYSECSELKINDFFIIVI